MAEERGVTFATPTTTAEARAEYRNLKAIPRQSPAERRREVRAVQDAMTRSGDKATVRSEEINGYGSSATWRFRA
jgi:hypothetical protein